MWVSAFFPFVKRSHYWGMCIGAFFPLVKRSHYWWVWVKVFFSFVKRLHYWLMCQGFPFVKRLHYWLMWVRVFFPFVKRLHYWCMCRGFLSLCETSFSTEKGSIKGENEGRREYLSVLLFSALRSLLCMFISIPSFFTIFFFFFFHGNAFRCIYLYESFICSLQVDDH